MTAPQSRRFFPRINPLTIALLVVVVLLGTTGGAVAGAMITGRQIKDGTVTTADIANSSLTGTDVRNSTLAGADVKDGSLTGADIADEALMWGAVQSQPFGFVGADAVVGKTFSSRAGYLQITATIDAADDEEVVGVDDLLYYLVVDGKYVNVLHELDFASEGDEGNGAITVVVKVAAGTHTVQLVGEQVSETGDSSFVLWGAELSVVYTAAGSTNAVLLAGRPVAGRVAR